MANKTDGWLPMLVLQGSTGGHLAGPVFAGSSLPMIQKETTPMSTLNSDLYDHPALYDALLPATGHVPYYVDLARQAGGQVLELACGTGQLTVPIAGAGLPAFGLDLSAPMLEAGRQRAAAAKVSVEFVRGDL